MRAAAAAGFLRSWIIYRALPGRARRLRRFYRPLVPAGALCFDIGAHIGNRTMALAQIGARVVAVEPQPAFAAFLRRRFRHSPRVTVVEAAIGPAPGRARLHLAGAAPTVASLSADWIARVGRTPGFAAVRWDDAVEVAVETLDGLIARYGAPHLCKIDVEGYEAPVLEGLSQPLPVISFEYLPVAPGDAHRALDRLAALGRWQFNPAVGETAVFHWPDWRDLGAIRDFLDGLPPSARPGDIHARLVAPAAVAA